MTFAMYFFLVLIFFFFGAYINSAGHHYVITTQNPAGVDVSMRKTETTSLAFLLASSLFLKNFLPPCTHCMRVVLFLHFIHFLQLHPCLVSFLLSWNGLGWKGP